MIRCIKFEVKILSSFILILTYNLWCELGKLLSSIISKMFLNKITMKFPSVFISISTMTHWCEPWMLLEFLMWMWNPTKLLTDQVAIRIWLAKWMIIFELWLSHDTICLFNYLLRTLCWQWTIFSENVCVMTFFADDFRKISSASHFLSILFPQIIIFSKQ